LIALDSNCENKCSGNAAVFKRRFFSSGKEEVVLRGSSRWSRTLPGVHSIQGLLGAQYQQQRSKTKAPYQQDVEPFVDDEILKMGTEEVRVVSADGTHEVLSVRRALHKAKRSNLNLVVVHQHASPPVCR
jgi:hypothetical protein